MSRERPHPGCNDPGSKEDSNSLFGDCKCLFEASWSGAPPFGCQTLKSKLRCPIEKCQKRHQKRLQELKLPNFSALAPEEFLGNLWKSLEESLEVHNCRKEILKNIRKPKKNLWES